MPGPVYQFGDFQLDCGAFKLLRNEQSLRVERKPLELLILLASRPGQLVTRTEIAQRLWSSEVFVDTEHGINTAIRKLRHLLRDDPDQPRFIQTVTGMGYRFIAAVSDAVPAANTAPADPVEVTPETARTAAPPISRSRHRPWAWYAVAGVCALLAFGGTALYQSHAHAPAIKYTQLTDFTDSAVQPAISPDGHMVAFIRGGNTFLTADQIYLKMLPNGEARRLTDDGRPKYSLEFSPDGSEIAYTALEGPVFSTYVISVLGGEPQLLLKNAAGLVWLDRDRLLFSEAPSGIHLGVVSATATRANLQQIYSPAHERGMAHYSFPSPDRRWAVVVEMNGDGLWAPCRLVALDSRHETRTVGPAGGCTSAGWSPDGRWMYFTAEVQGQSHVWQQRFPEGQSEQLTFGPTEENGIAVEPEGHALITSVGIEESSIWIHDERGERPLSSEGQVLWWPFPVFSPDGNSIYFLLRRRESAGSELWRSDVDSKRSEAVFPGVSMTAFDISPDGKQVVYTTGGTSEKSELWVAPIDRTSPPKGVNISGVRAPRFGDHGQILFQRAEGSTNYLEKMEPDGTKPTKVIPYPISDFQGVSPGRRWATLGVLRSSQDNSAAIVVASVDGRAVHRVCVDYCQPKWSIDGRFLFVPVESPTRTTPGKSLAIPIGPDEALPDLPAGGIPAGADPGFVRGAQLVDRAQIIPGRDPQHYAWVNATVNRNLYQLSIP